MSRTVSAVCLSARMRVSATEKESDGRIRAPLRSGDVSGVLFEAEAAVKNEGFQM